MVDKKELILKFFENEEYYSRLVRICMMAYRRKDLVEDVMQDMFIKLTEDAERQNFPENQVEAFIYVRKALLSRLAWKIRQAKRLPQVSEEFAMDIIEAVNPDALKALEKLNVLILQAKHGFSAEQLKLWECIYQKRTPEETDKILGKKRSTIHVMRCKLFSKIRKRFKREDIYGDDE